MINNLLVPVSNGVRMSLENLFCGIIAHSTIDFVLIEMEEEID